MRPVRSLLFIFAFSVVAGPAFAGLAVSPGTASHTHSDANTGGDALAAGTFRITNAIPQAIFIESDATADNGRWQFNVNNEAFYLQAVNDANTVGPVVFQVDRTGTVVDSLTLATTLGSSKACAVGFTRITPNSCSDSTPTVAALTRDSCTAVAASAADSKAEHLWLNMILASNNAIADRSILFQVYTDAACTAGYAAGSFRGTVQFSGREFAAVAAATTLYQKNADGLIPLPSAGSTIYVLFSDDTGNQNQVSIGRLGYLD